MRREVLIPLGVLVLCGAISILRSPSVSEGEGTAARAPQTIGPSVPYSVTVKSPQPTTTPAASIKSAVPQKGSSTMSSSPFPYDKELKTYLDLQAKVFMTDEDKQKRHELLTQPTLLKALGEKLLQPSRSLDAMNDQDTALDMLMEALKTGDSDVAAEVLGKVVKDGQVENAKLDRGDREQLAGFKAEVLYQWSALAPNMASNLEAMLPGPVSRKIWANVVKMQQSNLAESQAQADTRRATAH